MSLLGSGVIATIISGVLDAGAARSADTRADEAADRTLERSLKSVKATQGHRAQARAGRAQEKTVDRMIGHAWFLLTDAARQPTQDGRIIHRSPAATTIADDATGRLAGTVEGEAVIVAYAKCKDAFRGVEGRHTMTRQISIPAVQKARDDLGVAAKRWRDAASGPAGQ